MEKENFLDRISTNFNHSANVRNVFGEPIQADGKTIIPVAKIAYGYGGGYGQGPQKNEGNQPREMGSGGGGGGGLYATATGVYEITANGTRFIPASPYKHILLGVVLGFIFKTLVQSKRK
jgi:uncharacterized spore protein YtfJ